MILHRWVSKEWLCKQIIVMPIDRPETLEAMAECITALLEFCQNDQSCTLLKSLTLTYQYLRWD